MWFAGMVIGAAVGSFAGGILGLRELWLFGAAIGAAAGILYKQKIAQAAAPQASAALEKRVAALENEVRELKLRGQVVDSQTAVSTEPPSDIAAPQSTGAPVEIISAGAEPPEAMPAVAPLAVPDPAPAIAPQAETAPPEPPMTPAEPSWLWQKLFGGNILAKVGVVLLLIGVGSGLKLAIDFGMFPASVRLLIATVAGIGMIGFGFSRMPMREHRMFGLALQGGGFGVLYLVTYFALARYGYIEPLVAFILFAALGIACLAMAWRFEGEPLAILGISGAFMAPLLASTGSGSYIVLFSYYVVLDVMVVAVNVLRAWRVLTLIALAFTLVTGTSWALARFTPAAFTHTEAFLALFLVIFSLACVIRDLRMRGAGEPGEHWADAVLLFGTPIAAAGAQSWLIERMAYNDVVLAWSAVGAGLYYSALAALLFVRKAPAPLRIAHSAIAIGFYTIAIPLAFGVHVTTAFWAIEGLVLAWFGTSQRRALPYVAGLVLQLAAGVYFLIEWHDARPMPLLNGFYFGCLVIVGCGAASAWITKRGAGEDWLGQSNAQALPLIAGGWALAWWLAASFSEIARFAPRHHHAALDAGVFILTAWVLMAVGKALPSKVARYVGLVLAACAVLGGLYDGWGLHGRHPLHDSMIFALPVAFATLYAILRLNERDGLHAMLRTLHVYALLVLAVTLLRETLWLAGHLAPGVRLWEALAWLLVPAVLTYALVHLDRHSVWPVAAQRPAYLLAGAPMLLAVAGLAAIHANFNHAGGAPGVQYLPVASFFDVAQIAVILAIFAWTKAAQPLLRADLAPIVRYAPAMLGFIWLSAMAMRLAHHWGGVPFRAEALLQSGMAQSILSLLWTALALTLMISASRKMLRSRWFLGFALLGVVGAKFVLVDVINKGTITWTISLIGVGLLILAASYFSPAPPRRGS